MLKAFWLAAGSAQLVYAHTTFTNFFIDGVNQGDAVAVRMSNNNAKATFPISSVTSPDVACGQYRLFLRAYQIARSHCNISNQANFRQVSMARPAFHGL